MFLKPQQINSGLYIDGKDDRGVWTVQKDGSYLINTAHNISMIALPGKKYIGMVELAEKGTGLWLQLHCTNINSKSSVVQIMLPAGTLFNI